MKDIKKVAVFAFDGTIIRGRTLPFFLRFACDNLLVYAMKVLRSVPYVVLYNFRLLSKEARLCHVMHTFLSGKSRGEIAEIATDFVIHLNSRIDGKALQELQAKRLDGYDIVIVSDSLKEVIAPWATRYGVKDIVANELEYDKDGICTGCLSAISCTDNDMLSRLNSECVGIEGAQVVAVSRRKRLPLFEQIASVYCLV